MLGTFRLFTVMEHNQHTPRRHSRPSWDDWRDTQVQNRQPRDWSRQGRTSRRDTYSPMDRNWQDRRDRRTSWSPPRGGRRDQDPTAPRGQRYSRYRSPPPRNSPRRHMGTDQTRYIPTKRVRFQPLIATADRATVAPTTTRGCTDSDTSSDQQPTPRPVRASRPRPTLPSTSTSSGDVTDESEQMLENPTDILVKALVELLKAKHHLYEVTTVTQHQLYPEGYSDEILKLKQRFTPSHPRPETCRKLTEAAEQFMKTGYEILEEHYTVAIRTHCATLPSLAGPNLEEAWTAACSQASAGLRIGLKASTIEQTRALLPEILTNPATEVWEPPVSQMTRISLPVAQAAEPHTLTRNEYTVANLVTMPDSPTMEYFLIPSSQEPDSHNLVAPAAATNDPTLRLPSHSPLHENDWSDTWGLTPNTSEDLPSAQRRPSNDSLRQLLVNPVLTPLTPMRFEDTQSPTNALTPDTHTPPAGSNTLGGATNRSWAQRTVHHHPSNKSAWTLSPTHPIIIMGDSNLKWLPYIPNPNIQIDSYPGATIAHAANILSKLPAPHPEVSKVILSFGLNSRNRGTIQSFGKTLRETYDLAVIKFPRANIWIPKIAFSSYLPREEHVTIHAINDLIGQFQHIEALPRRIFRTQPDNIHWLPDTGMAIWDLWQKALN